MKRSSIAGGLALALGGIAALWILGTARPSPECAALGTFLAARLRLRGRLGEFGDKATIRAMHRARPDLAVFVDIGANRGQTMSAFIDVFVPGLASMFEEESGIEVPPQRSIPLMVAVEPLPVNAALLRTMRAKLPAIVQARMHIVEAAIVPLPAEDGRDVNMGGGPEVQGEPGDQHAKVGGQGSGAHMTVLGRTLDSLLTELGIAHIDLLKIDAEGMDPSILQTAHVLGDVTLFEYGDIGRWKETSLFDMVQTLAARGFDCFLCTDHATIPLTPPCWMPQFELREWSNIVAVRRGVSFVYEA